jgi:hypothetical protein
MTGPSAYCIPCQQVGMSNCGYFDECDGATCITCHRPLSLTRNAVILECIRKLKTTWAGNGGPPDDPHPSAMLVNETIQYSIETLESMLEVEEDYDSQYASYLEAGGEGDPMDFEEWRAQQ